MRFACRITKAAVTHWEYVILIIFQRQTWLHQSPWMLCYAYFACIFSFLTWIICNLFDLVLRKSWAVQLSRYRDWLQRGRSGDRIPVGARFSAPVQTGPGAHPASCKLGTVSNLGVKSGRGVTLTPHHFKCCGQERVELYLYSLYGPYGLYRASMPVQGCTLP